jgi:hypothetical protein
LIPSLRSPFNQSWSPAKYDKFLRILSHRFHEEPPFRHSETPCFLRAELVERADFAGREMLNQLVSNPEYLQAAKTAIPPSYLTPGDAPVPLFVQADFGLDELGDLKLVEIQGFPSLYGYQPVLSDAYRQAYNLGDTLLSFPGNQTASTYKALLSEAIVAQHDPENVALLEIDPFHQKTRHDFVATGEMLGIAIVDARSVVKQGNRLYYEREGKLIPIKRLYNRVIADELERREIQLPFDFRDELDVEWAGHPNWFFLLSKFSLPYLQHPAAPKSVFLTDAAEVDDLASYVLKPLYSFAGSGVIIGPTQAEIDEIPLKEHCNYLLQQRVNFTPSVETPEGPTKIEIRVMYIWLDEPVPVNMIIRMGRGTQMGVDHNKGLGWVGASAAFIQPIQPGENS